MAKAINQKNRLTIGHVGFGTWGPNIRSVQQSVHNEDTDLSRALDNILPRFLDIDTPEICSKLPDSTLFVSVSSQGWEDVLSDTFDRGTLISEASFSKSLVNYITQRIKLR